MIAKGEPLPSLRCFVTDARTTDLRDLEPGDHLVVYIAGAGVRPDALDDAARWPLPTLPRTAFAIVDHVSSFQGFLRTHTVEDVALVVRRTLDPPPNCMRAVVVAPDRTVLDVVDESNVSLLRSKVSIALNGSPFGVGLERLDLQVEDPDWERRYPVLAGRGEMILSPLVATAEHVGSTAVPGVLARPIVDVAMVLGDGRGRGEAIERMVGVGYGYVGDLGLEGRDLLLGPTDEPPHHVHLVVAATRALDWMLQFRDSLRRNSDLAGRYSEAKRLAAAIDVDLGAYASVKRRYFEG